jgi:hypothetical protein
MSENQRLREALDLLKSKKEIHAWKDIAEIIGGDKNRVSYLTKNGGGKIKSLELKKLEESFPTLNWDYVVSGEGDISDRNMLREPRFSYGEIDKEAELMKIVSRTSNLPIEQRENLLIEGYLKQTNKLARMVEVDNKSLMSELKDLLKRK